MASKRPATLFSPNAPRRKGPRLGAIISGVTLFIFLLVALAVLPREIPAVWQRLLGLACAYWAWLTWWLATRERELPEELLYRIRRGQNSDFGKQLLLNRPKPRSITVPGFGKIGLKTLAGLGIFVMVGASWFTPLAPIRVSRVKIEDLTIPLGRQIMAAALVLPNGQTAVTAPPVVPGCAKMIAQNIGKNADGYHLGLKAIAEGRFQDARTLLQTAADDGRTDAARVELARAQNEIYAQQFSAAVPLLEGVLAKSPDDPAILCQLAMVWIHMGQFAKAEQYTAQAAKACKDNQGAKNPACAAVMHLEALLLTASGKDVEKALDKCRLARENLAETHQGDHPISPASLNNQAVLYILRGNYPGAEELLNGALDGWIQLSGDKHPDTGIALANLAMLDYDLGRFAGAKKRLAAALAIFQEDSPLPRIAALSALAVVHNELAEYDEARQRAEESRKLAEKTLAVEHRAMAPVLDTLGTVTAGEGRYYAADGHYIRALAFAKKAWGEAHPYLTTILNHRSELFIEQRRYQDAEALIRQVLDISRRTIGPDCRDAATALYLRGLSAVRQEQANGVRADLEKALKIQRGILGAEHPDIARTMGCLAALDNSPQTYTAGVNRFNNAIAMAEKCLGADHPLVADLLVGEARLWMEREKLADAEKCLEKALALQEERLPPAHPSIPITLDVLAEVLSALTPPHTDRAKELLERAASLRQQHAELDRSE